MSVADTASMNSMQKCHITPMWHFCFVASLDPTTDFRSGHHIGSIAGNFDVTRQAISLLVKVLTDCGPVRIEQRGRDKLCKADLDKLSEVSPWVDQYRQHWERKLDALESYLEQLKREKHGNREGWRKGPGNSPVKNAECPG